MVSARAFSIRIEGAQRLVAAWNRRQGRPVTFQQGEQMRSSVRAESCAR